MQVCDWSKCWKSSIWPEDRLEYRACARVSGQRDGRTMSEWPSHVPVVIFHRGQPLRMHGMQRPHVPLLLANPFLTFFSSFVHSLSLLLLIFLLLCISSWINLTNSSILLEHKGSRFTKFKKCGYFRRFPSGYPFGQAGCFQSPPHTASYRKLPDNFCTLVTNVTNAAQVFESLL